MSYTTKAVKPPQNIYSPPQYAALTIMEKEPDYMVHCPKCDKRTIDVSEMPERTIKLRYKCPHCRSIVIVPLSAEAM
jgi:predicted RNA-binding Zn-ribbon protein involved in translation (DUF1610 family)